MNVFDWDRAILLYEYPKLNTVKKIENEGRKVQPQ